MVISAATVAAEADGGKPAYSNEHNRCLKISGGIDRKMVECISTEFERQDRTLNDTYRQLTTKLESENRNALKRAERAWVAFRDAQCGFEYAEQGEGTLAPVVLVDCKLKMTIVRNRELRHFLDIELKYGGQ